MIMRLQTLILVLLFVLSGCATTQYGNHVQNNSPTHNKVMAGDAAHQLLQLYPPASTRFNMRHAFDDSFGVAFLEYLRSGGYAVQEHKQQSNLIETDVDVDVDVDVDTDADQGNKHIELAYILDESSEIYRLSLLVDEQKLTRAYAPHEDTIYAAGHWLRME